MTLHLDTCEACRELVIAAVRSQIISTVGARYRIERLIGSGGMGEVYEAFDLKMQRMVALKLVRLSRFGTAQRPETDKRLVREARAMAMLHHPNVVTAYDVGTHDDHVFVAMQLVDGKTLRAWLAAEPRSVAQILRVLCDAGAGLVAAHRAQLVHRDFKPDNVLVARDGTALVTDFGLARRIAEHELENVTRTGAVIGTPGYLAPEQAAGEVCDARTDQFSFCVTAWEALYGKRPSGSAVLASTVRHVPRAVQRALRRGLSPDPGERFPTMAELVAILERALHAGAPRRGLPIGAVAVLTAAVVAIAGGVGGTLQVSRVHTAARSDAPVSVLIADFANHTSDPVFDGTLEPAFRVALETVPFVSTYRREVALEVAATLRPGTKTLDPEIAQLIATREGIAVVLVGSIERAGDRYVTRVRLLDAMRGRELAAVADEAETPDGVLHSVARLGTELATALGDSTPESVRLAAAETYTAGSVEAAHAYAACIDAHTRAEYDETIARCQRAIALDPAMGRAYALIGVAMANRGRTQEADHYLRLALANLGRMTDRERRRTRGVYFGEQGDLDSGIQEFSALVEQYPADNAGYINLAFAYAQRRDFARAVTSARRAVALDPRIVHARSNLGRALFYSGDLVGAAEELEALIRDHPKFARAYRVMAVLDLLRDRVPQAIERWKRLAATGVDGASDAQLGLADVALYEGRIADAITQLEHASASELAAGHPDGAARELVTLGHAYILAGRASDGRRAFDQALRASRSAAIPLWAARGYVELGDDATASAIARELGAQVGQLRRVDAALIEGELLLVRGKPLEAIERLRAAQRVIDTWLGRLDLARAYIAAGAYAQATAEIDVVLRRLPEGASALIDEQPTAYLLPQAYYLHGRALEGIGSPQAADAYRKLLAIAHAEPARDPMVLDARERLARIMRDR